MKLKKLTTIMYLIVTLLLPVGLTGIGLIGDRTFTNIALSDVLIAPLFCTLVINASQKNNFLKLTYSEKNYVLYTMLFVFIALISFINILRFDGQMLISVFNLFKLCICFAYGFVFMIYFENCNQKEWETFIEYALVSGLVFSFSCILGAVLFMFGIDSVFIDNYVNTYRATGLQEDPNTASIFQIMTISYALLYLNIKKVSKLKGYICIAFLLVGVLTTGSKSGILTLVTTSIIISILLLISRMRKIIVRLMPIIIIGILSLLLLVATTTIFDTILSRLTDLSSGNAATAMTSRNFQWEAAIKLIIDNPINLLMGIGIGQFEHVANEYNLYTVSYSVHNTYLSLLVECGFFLFALVVLFFVYLISRLSFNVMHNNMFSLCALWGIISIAIFMASMNFQNNRMAYVFIIFICCSLGRIRKKELSMESEKND